MWEFYQWFAAAALISILIGSLFGVVPSEKKYRKISDGILLAAVFILAVFIAGLWHDLGRPPMRTLGETRLWYSFFLLLTGVIVNMRFRIKLFLAYTAGMSILFMSFNIFMPEIRTETLMPALQSPWFIPHVIVYMVAYAFLGIAAILGFIGIIRPHAKNSERMIEITDKVVYAGFGFLSLGLIFGALWAKEAWGHFWTWDPKETWALLTWLVYLIYIHMERRKHFSNLKKQRILLLGFVILIICWFGITYLPTAAESVHVYS